MNTCTGRKDAPDRYTRAPAQTAVLTAQAHPGLTP